MTFLFDPKNAEEKKFICLPKGEYEVEINEVVQKVSKAGNDMLELTLTAYAEDGSKVRLFDYIVNGSGLWKLKALCKATGIEFDGTLEEQLLVGKRMMARIDLRKATEKYGEKNQIDEYLYSGVKKVEQKPVAVTPATAEVDDLPF
tara:strand:+ start:65 stop:502 length:438 start_codon:yes stop_codon:yes gene_type:complete